MLHKKIILFMLLAFPFEIDYYVFHRLQIKKASAALLQGRSGCGMDNHMFRLWGRTFKDNRLLQDTCIDDGSQDTRTHKIFRALDEICLQFDLARPIWLNKTIADFKRHSKVRFTQDNFIESIDFDYLEIQIIEED